MPQSISAPPPPYCARLGSTRRRVARKVLSADACFGIVSRIARSDRRPGGRRHDAAAGLDPARRALSSIPESPTASPRSISPGPFRPFQGGIVPSYGPSSCAHTSRRAKPPTRVGFTIRHRRRHGAGRLDGRACCSPLRARKPAPPSVHGIACNVLTPHIQVPAIRQNSPLRRPA